MQSRISALSVVRLAVFALLTPLAFADQPVVPSRVIEPVDETKLTLLKGNIHPLARRQFDRGLAPPDLPMDRMLLVLKRSLRQESALRTLLDEQQDKASPNYHRWLTPEQFGLQFGPNDHDIQAVSSWLQSQGFQIAKVAKGRTTIEFSGVASQVQEAFHTSIHRYVVKGEDYWANANEPQIPTALTPVVAGVFTLHNFIKKPMIHIAEHRLSARLVSQGDGKPPKVTFPGNPPLHALGPADYAKIYDVNPLYNASPAIQGTARTIAVVGRSDLYNGGSDITGFAEVFGITYVNPPGTVLDGPDPGDLGGDEEAEATLDTTWSSAIAPGAGVSLVVSATTNTTDGVDLSELYIVDNNLADIMTESFGGCEALATNVQGTETLAEQAAAEGITYFVAAGDSGAEGCDDPDVEAVATGPLSVNVLASTPFDVAVGGTMFNENGDDSKYWSSTNSSVFESALSYIPEDVWNQSCTAAQCGSQNANIFAGGGGASSIFPKPSWQSGVAGIPDDGRRDVPDVSLTAAGHDPYLLCLEGSCIPDSQGYIYFAAVAGTSASTPSFAGMMALVDQKMNARQGQAQYVLYKLAAAEKLSSCNASNTSGLPAGACVFNDVTVGNNAVPGEASYGTSSPLYPATVGYDLATGLGSVNAANLVNNWNSVTFNPTTTTLTIVQPSSPVTITHGSPVKIDFAVTAKSGTPTGSVALLPNTGPTPNQQSSVGVFPLVSGSAAQTVSSLPGGTYTLQARYSGDGTFAPSTSLPSPAITVNPEPSTTTLSALTLDQNLNFIPFTAGPYGSFVYLLADVAGQSKQGIPSGPVSFLDEGSPIQGYSDISPNSQGNVATPNFLNSPPGGTPTGLFTLAVGPHSITAAFTGDPSFQASTSSPVTLNITQASTNTVIASAPAPKGSTFTATIDTNSGGTPPTGTVTFFLTGTQLGSPVGVAPVPALTTLPGALLGAQATATYNAAALPNGSYAVKATYNGDSNYAASSSATTLVTQKSDFSFSGGSTPAINITSPGGDGTLTLTITALDGYNGTINFASSSCSGLPAGATCSFSPTAVTGSGTTKLTVTTTAASARLVRPGARPGWWLASFAGGLACVFLVGGYSRRSGVLSLVLCALFVTGIGCGGGSNSGGSTTPTAPPPPTATPTGTSNVVVTATSGTLTHSVTFVLSVQ
ncbi:MAG TPA: Ig-like domain repeat protein [Terriglobales bacterium]|nr:Ig-like domain repeat protein [Terriglobales bacterium]